MFLLNNEYCSFTLFHFGIGIKYMEPFYTKFDLPFTTEVYVVEWCPFLSMTFKAFALLGIRLDGRTDERRRLGTPTFAE